MTRSASDDLGLEATGAPDGGPGTKGNAVAASRDRALAATAASDASDALAATGAAAPGLDATMDSGGRRQETDGSADAGTLPTASVTRYAIEREIGRGGLGRVMRARDRVLDRTVAVKEILEGDEDSHRRFVREALITARLQHPAIVPLYEAGRWKDGTPFYAMRLIRGRPLSELLEGAALERRLALLPAVQSASDAVAYAHSERIIHRDLKPGNVMVGDYGETVVIDWGLAKDLSIDDRDALEAGPYRAVSGDQTIAGAVMGTPAYMAPEQARGETVDERSDVYALGAMLYHVLSGENPHEQDPRDELLARIRAGRVAPLRERAAELPADLVAIVEKSMAADAVDRYPTGKEFAEDLRRFQAGQLVGAHRYSLGELLRRWLRRHRTAVTVAALLVTLLIGVVVVAAGRVLDERRAAREERAAAERLVDHMLTDLHDRLEAVGRLDAMEGSMSAVDAYYESFGTRRRGPLDLARRARELEILGGVRRAAGDLDGALAALLRARDVRDELVRREPRNTAFRQASAGARGRVSKLLADRGDLAGAESEARAAVAALSPEGPVGTEGLDLVARATALRDLAAVLNRRGSAKEALDVQREAVALLERAEPGTGALTNAKIELGELLLVQGDSVAAAAAFDGAVVARRAASHASPRDASLGFLVAEATRLRGQARRDLGRLDAAEEDFAAAITRLRALLELEPKNEHWRAELVLSLSHLGNLRPDRGDVVGALKAFEDAAVEQRALLAGNPAHFEWRRNASNLLCKIAHWRGVIGTGTEDDLERCISSSTVLADEYPANARLRDDVAQAHEEHGLWRLSRGDAAVAEAAIRQAVAIREPALAAGRIPDAVRHLAINYQQLSDALAAKGDASGARAEAERALGLFRELAALRPDHPPFQRDLYTQLVGIGFLDEERGDLAPALASYKEALSISERLAAASQDSVQALSDHAYALYSVALIEVQDATTRAAGIAHADDAIRIFASLERDGRIGPQQLAWLKEVRDLRARAARLSPTVR